MTDPVQLTHNESQNKTNKKAQTRPNKKLSQAEKLEIPYLVLPSCKEIEAQISVPGPELQAKGRVEKRTGILGSSSHRRHQSQHPRYLSESPWQRYSPATARSDLSTLEPIFMFFPLPFNYQRSHLSHLCSSELQERDSTAL